MFQIAFYAESKKYLKSKVFWILLAFFLFLPLMMGLLMALVKHPELASKMGIVATSKSQMIGNADWPNYFSFLGQLVSIGGVFGFGFMTSWIFGREYSDKTLKDLLALPASRLTLINAKLSVIAVFSFGLSMLMFIMSTIVGLSVGLGDITLTQVLNEWLAFEVSALLLICLCTPVALFANIGRGYLLPLGLLVLIVILAQFVGVIGLAPYFPWALPALFFDQSHGNDAGLSLISYAIWLLTCVAGYMLTIYWWYKVDQT